MAEGKSEEHSLEYQELFNEYLLIFEGKLEEFIGQPQTSTVRIEYTQNIWPGYSNTNRTSTHDSSSNCVEAGRARHHLMPILAYWV